MRIPCPCCGERMVEEFTYLGDRMLMDRPDEGVTTDFIYLRDNPAGRHSELWYHEQGDRSWLVVTRNTVTHEVLAVELAADPAEAQA